MRQVCVRGAQWYPPRDLGQALQPPVWLFPSVKWRPQPALASRVAGGLEEMARARTATPQAVFQECHCFSSPPQPPLPRRHEELDTCHIIDRDVQAHRHRAVGLKSHSQGVTEPGSEAGSSGCDIGAIGSSPPAPEVCTFPALCLTAVGT